MLPIVCCQSTTGITNAFPPSASALATVFVFPDGTLVQLRRSKSSLQGLLSFTDVQGILFFWQTEIKDVWKVWLLLCLLVFSRVQEGLPHIWDEHKAFLLAHAVFCV